MADDITVESIVDEPVGVIVIDARHGLVINVPGSAWADEYISFAVHDEGYVVSDDDDQEYEYLSADIPLERIGEVRASIDAAVAELERRRTERK